MRKEREKLLEDKLRDSEIIAAKTRELESLANRLAKYLSPQIYNSIFADSSGTKESFARKNLTIFFSDIEGFTAINDGMEPEKLAYLINSYLSEMSDIAIEYGGTIDKFIGDAILIFFGDPETEGDHKDAIKCVEMAVRMRERMAELQKGLSGAGNFKATAGAHGDQYRLLHGGQFRLGPPARIHRSRQSGELGRPFGSGGRTRHDIYLRIHPPAHRRCRGVHLCQ